MTIDPCQFKVCCSLSNLWVTAVVLQLPVCWFRKQAPHCLHSVYSFETFFSEIFKKPRFFRSW